VTSDVDTDHLSNDFSFIQQLTIDKPSLWTENVNILVYSQSKTKQTLTSNSTLHLSAAELKL